ncbi:iron complex transport system substrate-binding protein [Azospirillum agricola]|uniref:ABC transporter substrate-binding protein n=1 Tax=Azospirillum agricola TaxID=1720247 RepID=UPI002D7F34F1|nr:ABC transporter substrate-binding protein [Azospirillum agricola]MBP2227866.1 iron complex transport system substrate-binding protein [Azospirillum agricola]
MRLRHLLGLAAAVLPLAGGPALAGGDAPRGKPQRIVSLNLCADELLLRLVGPERVASVTWLARDPRGSTVAAQAAAVPVNRGLAEEVVPLRPDLVLAGKYTTRTAVGLLRRLDIPLLELDVPQTVEGVAEQIRTVAQAVGEPERGEELVAGMTARLDALAATAPERRTTTAPERRTTTAPERRTTTTAPERRPTAVVLRPNGFVAGSGSLVDALMTRAGLDNLADRLPLGSQGALPLEAIILGGAERLIIDAAPDAPPSLAHAMLHHPAVEALSARIHTIALPSRLWTCAGPQIADAADLLAAGREPAP